MYMRFQGSIGLGAEVKVESYVLDCQRDKIKVRSIDGEFPADVPKILLLPLCCGSAKIGKAPVILMPNSI